MLVPPASAQFGPPFDISAAGEDAAGAQLAVDAAGAAIVIWERWTPVEGSSDRRVAALEGRRISPAGNLGPVVVIASNPGTDLWFPQARLAVDSAGHALIVWQVPVGSGGAAVLGRRLAPDGSLGAVLAISPPEQHARGGLQVATDGEGTATVVWTTVASEGLVATTTIELRRIAWDGSLSPVIEVAAESALIGEEGPFVYDPHLAVDPVGAATVAWRKRLPKGEFFELHLRAIEARLIHADGTPAEVQPIESWGSLDSGDLDLAVAADPSGSSVVLWGRQAVTCCRITIAMRRIGTDGTAQAVEGIAGSGPFGPARFAVDLAGTVTVALASADGILGRRIPIGDIGSGFLLSPALQAREPQVAVNFTGTATAVWAVADMGGTTVQARQIAPDDSLGPLLDLSEPGSISSSPMVAMASDGGVTVIWHRSDGGRGIVRAAQSLVSRFADAPRRHPLWPWMEALFTAGITSGCGISPLRFCPEASVTRAEIAVLLLRGIGGPGATPPSATGTVFGDVLATDPFAAWIEELAAMGITAGCGGGNFCPTSLSTRGQMAVLLLRALHGPGYMPPGPSGSLFADVPDTHPFAAWIEQLAREGITAGCTAAPARYCPDSAVSRGQMAVFLVRGFGLPGLPL